MANHKSALKRIRRNEAVRLRNRYQHKTTRNAIKKLRNEEDKKKAEALLPSVVSMIDKLAKRNIIHSNKASNLKSKLMKQVALGRKAWLFVGNVAAGERSAMMMSLVSSAKRHDLDVTVYIKDVLDQLLAGSTDYHSLLPDIWKQSHPEAIRIYRQQERRDKADRKQVAAARRRLARGLAR